MFAVAKVYFHTEDNVLFEQCLQIDYDPIKRK